MDMAIYARFVVALVFVLALIGVFALVLRRFGPMAGLAVRRPGERRLKVVEVLALDARRRLMLVSRDGVEHLLLLGMTDDRVVETGIPAPRAPGPEAGGANPGGSDFRVALARLDGHEQEKGPAS